MIHLCRFYSKTFRIITSQLNHTSIINSRPLKLLLTLLTIRHHQPPLDLYPRIGYIVIFVLELIQLVLEFEYLVLLDECNALIELSFDGVNWLLLLLLVGGGLR